MKRFSKMMRIVVLALAVSFAFGKRADAASFKQICPEADKGSVKIGSTRYSMKYNDIAGCYTIVSKKGSATKKLLSGVTSNMVVTDGKYIYYSKTPMVNGIISGKSIMYRYTIATGKKKKLFKKNLCDGSTEYGAVPCFAYKNYLYYGSQSQYGGRLWSLYVYNTKTKKSKKLKISGLVDGCSVKKSGNWIKVSIIDHAFGTVTAKYKFNLSGSKVKKIK